MKATNYKQAREQAQANADYFGYAFCVLESTNGSIFVERFYQPAEFKAEVFYPKNQENRGDK